MRHLNEYQHHLRVLLEPYDAKVSRTVLRGESPSNGADLLDSRWYIIGSSMRGKKSDSESSDSLNNHTPKKFSTTKMSLE